MSTASLNHHPTNIVTTRAKCVFCDSSEIEQILDLGQVALAGGFLKPEDFDKELTFPLRLFFCQSCFAVQLIDIVNASHLFRNYFYFSSAIGSLQKHFAEYASEVVTRFLEPKRSTAIEIGCNDGVLLRPLADQQIRTVIGVDPASNVVATINDPRLNIINDFFSETTADEIKSKYGKADLIVANNVFAHIPDICGITRGVTSILADDGVFVFEVHYLGKVMQELQYDMIYHEHLYYHSLISLMNFLDRFDLCVFDVKPISIHAGSMRYYVARKASKYAKDISQRVMVLAVQENAAGYNNIRAFVNFASRVKDTRRKLIDCLNRIRQNGRRIAGYGASGRANTIIQFCGIDKDYLDYMIDDAPAKIGYYTPGSHLPILSKNILVTDPPDYILNFAWGYLEEIVRKCNEYLAKGGRMIVPLPKVRTIVYPFECDDTCL